MNVKEKAVREPLFQIVKRDKDAIKLWKAILIRALAIFGAFVFISILAWMIIKIDPFTFIGKMLDGVFGFSTSSNRRIWITVRNLAILLCFAVALAPAFKMKFWNIGAEGQVLMGGLACAACMYYLGGILPDALVWIIMSVAGILMGIIWAVIPAIFKAIWNTNETLFTLMMNYVAIQLVKFFTDIWVKDGSGTLTTRHLHNVKLPEIGNAYLLPVIVVAVLTALMFVYLKYSKHGYELSVVGESEDTAKYIGVNVKKVIIRTMALSGAVCGIAGILLVGAINGTVNTSTAGGQGFTGIIVAWLGKFNPIYMVLTAFLLIFLNRGTVALNLTNNAFAEIITGIVIFIVLGCEFFIGYKIKIHKKNKR
ncbi:MAG: ABC transporter permease, partial [Clostridia bacterium]|nr:ABC transporter permease [Clostridia bacterium]